MTEVPFLLCTLTCSCYCHHISYSHWQEKKEKAKLPSYIDELKHHLQQLQQIHDHINKKADKALGHASPLQWNHSLDL